MDKVNEGCDDSEPEYLCVKVSKESTSEPCKSNSSLNSVKLKLKAKLQRRNLDKSITETPSKSQSSRNKSESNSQEKLKKSSKSHEDKLKNEVISRPDKPSTAKPEQFNHENLYVNYCNTLNRLIEDNFITMSLQDEYLALGTEMSQFRQTKYEELKQFIVSMNIENYNKKVIQLDNIKSTIENVQNGTRIWISSLKKIKSFKNLCVDDQLLCLRSHFTDLTIINVLRSIDPEARTVKTNGYTVSIERCPLLSNPIFLKMVSSMNSNLRLDPIVNIMVILIHLFDVNVPDLHSTLSVRKEYIVTIHLLQKYLEGIGFTVDQANLEIKNFLTELNTFLKLFNGRQKVLEVGRNQLVRSELMSSILDIKS